MKRGFLFGAVLWFGFGASVWAQTGKITGRVVDAATGDPLPGVNVTVEGTLRGAASDLDGNFFITNIPPGRYTLIGSMIGYARQRVSNVLVKGGEVTTVNFSLTAEVLQGREVVVEAAALRNTEAALLNRRRKAAAISDAVSGEELSRAGAANAAEAMARVTGASVVAGKYVYIRGLGERYASTMLNGAELPSADPDRKAVQMDLFPAEFLDNIVTIKTFTPDKPGNFAGGIVDITTKSFPERLKILFKSKISYNSETTFNPRYLAFPGKEIGFSRLVTAAREGLARVSGGHPAIPRETQARRDPVLAAQLDRASKDIIASMGPVTQKAPANLAFSLAFGNRMRFFGRPLGFILSVDVSNRYRFYENGQVGRWKLTGKVSENDSLTNLIRLKDRNGRQDAQLGTLVSWTYSLSPKHELYSNMMLVNSVKSEARYLVGHWPEQFLDNDNAYFETRALFYRERQLRSYQLAGRHSLPGAFRSTLEWTGSFSLMRQDEPDIRFFSDDFAYRTFLGRDTVIYSISPSIYNRPSRYFRALKENNAVFDLKWTLPVGIKTLRGKFKAGFAYEEKRRDFHEKLFEVWQGKSLHYNGDPAQFFSEVNSGIVAYDSARGRYRFGNFVRESLNTFGGDYRGHEQITAGFAMVDLLVTSRLRAIGGVRYEVSRMSVADGDTAGGYLTRDWLPSFNLVFRVGERANVRAAYGRTLARPNFREKAPYASYQFMNDVIFQGNVGLQQTRIDNFDLRWEWFQGPGEILSVSGFYKFFRNPIERVINLKYASEGAVVLYQNVSHAETYGLEFEARKGLQGLFPLLRHFRLAGNFSLVRSVVKIPADEMVLIRALNPKAKSERPLQGQSPYILNLELDYENARQGLEVGLHFNVFGERLAEVALGGTPNVYEQPCPLLDLVAAKKFGKTLILKLALRNLLNSSYRTVHHYKGFDYVRQEYPLGRTLSIGIGYDG